MAVSGLRALRSWLPCVSGCSPCCAPLRRPLAPMFECSRSTRQRKYVGIVPGVTCNRQWSYLMVHNPHLTLDSFIILLTLTDPAGRTAVFQWDPAQKDKWVSIDIRCLRGTSMEFCILFCFICKTNSLYCLETMLNMHNN